MSSTNPFYSQHPPEPFQTQGPYQSPFNPPQPSRPSWLIPTIVAAIVLAIVAVLAIWLVVSGGDDKETAAPPQTTVIVVTEDRTPSTPDSGSGGASVPTAVESAPYSSGSSGSTSSSHFGAGLATQRDCGTNANSAQRVFTGSGNAKCDFSLAVGDELAGRTVREGAVRNISVYSNNRHENVSLTCRKAQDSNRTFLWKCTTEHDSIIYVYP